MQTTPLVSEHDLIAVEDLKWRICMVRRPKPKAEPEQTDVFLPNGASAKAALNRLILQQGWSLWARRLKDEADASGVALAEVPAAHTSDSCRMCGRRQRRTARAKRCSAAGTAATPVTPTSEQHTTSYSSHG